MSDTQKQSKKPKLLWLIFFIAILSAVIWFMTREPYTNAMLSEVNDHLQGHELSWAGRGADYAQYTVTCSGSERNYQVLYRIPASTQRVPALVIAHMIDSPEAVFDLMNKAENAGNCAFAAINVSEFFKRDGAGELKLNNESLGHGLVDGLHAVELAIEFVRGHRIVDTTAVYVIGIGEAGLLVMPAAANYASSLKGVACIDADAMMSLKNWGSSEFASPIAWAKKANSLRALLVSTGGNDAAEGTTSFANAFASVEKIQASSPNVQDKYSVALGSVIDWIWKGRQRPDKQIKSEPPDPNKTVIIRK